jgi:hypothetical protein
MLTITLLNLLAIGPNGEAPILPIRTSPSGTIDLV